MEGTKIRNFTDLEAWKAAQALAVHVYSLTKKYPKDEIFGIVNQMRRAAVSVPSNIAEGFSRGSAKEKAQFYAIAKGSATELHAQLLLSKEINYISGSDLKMSEELMVHTNKLLTGLLRYTKGLS